MPWNFDMTAAPQDRIIDLFDPKEHLTVSVGYFEDIPGDIKTWWMMTEDGLFSPAEPIAWMPRPEAPAMPDMNFWQFGRAAPSHKCQRCDGRRYVIAHDGDGLVDCPDCNSPTS
jgi:hypothetical protein